MFGQMVWDEVTVPILVKYFELRGAKPEGDRELSVLSIGWGKARK